MPDAAPVTMAVLPEMSMVRDLSPDSIGSLDRQRKWRNARLRPYHEGPSAVWLSAPAIGRFDIAESGYDIATCFVVHRWLIG
jgi:hypothetical protein